MTCREGKSEDIFVDMCFMFPLLCCTNSRYVYYLTFPSGSVHRYPDNFESSIFPFGIRLPFHTHPANSVVDRDVFESDLQSGK